ncbi:MAG: MMPL family transporter [Solirubrobacterales bacterium]|nr:MMPL family transporter [Solirubrobacterales bacterium]
MLDSFAAKLSTHPRRTLFAVLAFVAVAGLIGGPLAGSLKSSGGFAPPGSDSAVATRQLQAATGAEPYPAVVLLVDTPQGARAAGSRIAALAARLTQVSGVLRVSAPAAVARDDRHVLIAATLRAGASDSSAAKAAEAAFRSSPGVIVGGSALTSEQISSTVTKDLGRAELLALPLLMGLSLLFFRGRAALMPVAVGLATVLGTFLALTAVNQLYGLNVFALNLVIGLGLGLAIDYTLFLVTRLREELAAGRSAPDAIAVTLARAGRTILFSATTVACALGTLVVFPEGFLKSMGIAGATVAIVAAFSALIISPALLGLWGCKLARGRKATSAEGRWYRFARAVMRRPAIVAGLTSVAMLAAASPALSVAWTPIDNAVIPDGQSSRTVADAITQEFDGAGQSPVTVAITAPRSDQAAVSAYAARVSKLPAITRLDPPRPLGDHTWQLDAHVSGDPQGATAQQAVNEIRATPAPFPTKVTGQAASFLDQQSGIASHLPVAIGLLALLTFIVLWLMTDSLVLPLKAITMNALTVGAALSPLVLIYQHGRLASLLGYTPNGGVEPTDFLVAATVVFALSTDYGVFLLGRIKEARDGGASEREAVASGLARTGRVVTAAAILLAVAIGAFSTSSISFIQQIGLATATGVLLDAFVVRSLLLPSLMALLGRWNWWAPHGAHTLRGRIIAPEREPAGRGAGRSVRLSTVDAGV